MYKKYFVFLIIVASFFFLGAESKVEKRFKKLRDFMVKNQIEARGVADERVLDALKKVPRHKFVPFQYQGIAYSDCPLPIGYGQTISQPYIVALMTELAALTGKEKVLEIGTGSGYQAAVLAELAQKVYTIEIVGSLAKRSQALLKDLGYTNIEVRYGDGFLGWPEEAPFDAIIVTCAPKFTPQPLVDQLAEGGKLVIPVGEGDSQELKLIIKEDGKPVTTEVIPVRFVPMRGMIEEMHEPALDQ